MSQKSSPRRPQPLSKSWSNLWLGAALVLATQSPARAVNWTAGSGTDFNWFTAANWDTGIPTAATDVFFRKDLVNFGPLGYPNPGNLPKPDVITLGAGSVANSLSLTNRYTLTGGDLALTTGHIRVTLGNSSQIDSRLTGSGGLFKEGDESLVLGNALNDYTGTTIISEGTVIITSQGALGTDTSAVQVTGNTSRGSGGGALVVGSLSDNTAGLTFTRDLAITGGGSTGDGNAFNSVGNNRFTGTITIGTTTAGLNPTGGTVITATGTRLAATSGTTTIEGDLILGPSGQVVQFGGNGNWEIDANMTGPATLEKAGNGLLVLKGNNSGFTGIVQTSGGFLRVSSAANLGSSTSAGAITLNGGVLEFRTDAPDFAAKKVTQANNATIFADRAIGGSGLNQSVGLGVIVLNSTTSTRTLTLNGRNGYGVTFTGNMAAASLGPWTIANNTNGLVTFAGNFWNTNNTTARALIFSGNGDTLITGGVLASGAAHTLTKQGTGTLTISGTASTYTGATTVEGGTLAITDFRSITNNTATINLGSTTTTAGTLSIVGDNLTQANLTTAKVVNLRGTTAAATILANQTGTSPGVIFTSNFTATGAGIKTLSLGGTNTANNEVRGAIIDNSSTNTTAVRKTGFGTWVLSGANTFTGGLQITSGTIKIQDTFSGASRDVIADAAPISFIVDTAVQNAAGTLEYIGADGAASTETLGSLLATAGAGTVKVTPGNGGTAALTFTGLGARANGGTINFAPAAGGSVILGTAAAVGYVGAFATFNGTDFAYAPATTGAVLRAPVYGTDAGFVNTGASLTAGSHNLVSGGTVTTGAMTISSLKVTGNPLITQTGALVINTGSNTAGGIIYSGGTTGAISGTSVSSGGSADLIIRVDGASDLLTLNAPISSTTTGGLTKTGAGTLVLTASNNNQTGASNLLEGTVKLSGTGRLSASNVSLNLRQGATLDLNGVNSSTIASLNGGGTITNSSATPVTVSIGNNNGTGTFSGLISDGDLGGGGIGKISLTKNGTGAQTWSGLNNYTGVTTIASTGIVSIPNLTNIGQPSGIGRGDAAANAASLVFTGASTTQAFGGISYSGGDSISINRLFTFGGTAASSGARIQANGVNNATLIFNNTGALAFSAGNTTAQGFVLSGASTGDNQFNPQITDNPNAAPGAAPTSLYKSDAGLWILGNSNNSYTGVTQLNSGMLRADGTALPANSPLVFNGGLFQSSGTFTRSLAATAVPGTGSVGWLSGTANGGFAASTDRLTVNLGGLATPAQLTWGMDGFVGGTLMLSSITSLAEVEIVNPIDLAGAVRTINVDVNSNTASDFATLSGVISGATGSGLTKTGTGFLRLNASNTYSGDTLINAGTIRAVRIGNSTSTSSSFGAGSGKISIGTGSTTGTLAYVGNGETTDRLIELGGTTASVVIESSGTGPLILTNVVNASTGTGAKTLFLRGDLSASNEITSVLANNSAGGAMALTKDDNGNWILSGANTYSGTTTISAGALGFGLDSTGPVGGVTAGPVGTGTLVSTNGSFFGYNGDRTINNTFTISGNATATFIGRNSLTFNGQLGTSTGGNTTITNSLPAGKTLTFNSPTYTGTETTSGRTLVFNGSGDTILNSSVTNSLGGGVIGFNYQGYGSLTLGGASTYTGTTTIQSGTVKLAIDEAIPSGTGKGNVTINPAVGLTAALDLNGHSQTINGLTANTAGTITIDNTAAGAASLTFGANDQAVTLIGGITNTGTGPLSITKTGTAAANLSVGPFSYKGATTVIGGTLTISENVSGTTALSVSGTGSQLNLSGGLSASPLITSVNVGAGALLNLFDSQGTPISNLTSLTLGAGSILNLNAGTTSDTLTLLTGNVASVTGQVTLNVRDTGSMVGNTTYNLLVASGGGLTTGGSYMLSQIPGGFTGLTLNQTDTLISLTTGQLIQSSIYWTNGAADGKWNSVDPTFRGLNFSKDKAGSMVSDFVPGAGTVVVFQADSLTGGGAVSTTLEQGFRINALEFEGSTVPANTPASVSIAPGAVASNRLTIDPSDSSAGINLKAGGPTAVTISAPVGVGSNQTWTVASAGSSLTVSGPLSGPGALTKAGAGKVTLGAAADATFGGAAVTVNGGSLELTNTAALGTALGGNLAPISVSSGATFYYNNATAGTIANALTLNGATLAASGNSQTYSGTINLAGDSTISTRDAGVTVGTVRTMTLSGVISGPGKMTVNGNTAVSGGSSITGTVVLTQANPNWTGGLLMQQGTMDLRNEQSLGTGAVTVNLARFLFKGSSGSTWNQMAAGLTVDNPGGNAVVELQADNQTATDLFTADITGPITLGSATSPGFIRLHHADSLSAMRLSGPIVMRNNGSIHTSGGTANTQTAVIASVISESGGSFSLKLNGDTAWGSNNYQVIRLDGANTFTGGLTVAANTVEFSTVTNLAGGASNLGQGGPITMTGGTLRFIGGTSQSTDRPITFGASAGLQANGVNGATITFAGPIDAATVASSVTLTGTGAGFITGGLTQSGTSVDILVNSGDWTIRNTPVTLVDDIVVTGTTAALSFGTTGVLTYTTGTSNGLFARNGGTFNLLAHDISGANNSGGLDFIILADSTAGAPAVLNTNGFNLTLPRLDVGAAGAGLEGTVTGTGTLTFTATVTDYSQGIRTFRGQVDANLAGVSSFLKQGLGEVILTGDNSGLTGTVAATRIDAGTLTLDYSRSNAEKLSSTAALDLRGATVNVKGGILADTIQAVGGLTINAAAGANRITVTSGGFATNLVLGALTHGTQFSTLRLDLPALGSVTTSTANAADGTLGGWFTVTDATGAYFAKNDGAGNIVPVLAAAKNDVTTWATGDHITDAGTGFTGLLGSANIGSLRFNAAGGSTLNLNPSAVVEIANGGVLVTSAVTAPTSISGGYLRAGTADLVFTQDSTAPLKVSSAITGTTAVVKTGTGTLELSSSKNIYTGATHLADGTLQVSGGNAIGDNSLITMADDRPTTLQLLADETIGRLQGGTTGSTVDVGAHTLTLNNTAGSTTLSAAFSGTGTIVKIGGNTGLNLNVANPDFTGTVVVNGGLFQLSSSGTIAASNFIVNKNGALLLDNNGTTRSSARIVDTATISLNSADGLSSSLVRGLWIRTDQAATTNETVGEIQFASGANYLSGDASGTSGVTQLIADNFTRSNNATIAVRARNLGGTSSDRVQFRIGTTANETAFIAANLVGGTGTPATSKKIVPWGIGERTTATLVDANMGNTFVTYVAGQGFVALDFTTDYAGFGAAAATDNVREVLAADLTGLAGKSINSLVLHNGNATPASTLAVTGTGAGQALALASGAMLFTVNTAASTAQGITVGGFDAGITTGTGEYVIHVVNPIGAATSQTLTATIDSPLTSQADLTKSGRGTLVLTGVNTAGGGANRTTINEGVLQIADLDNIGGNTGTLSFGGGTLRLTSAFADNLFGRTLVFQSGGGTLETDASLTITADRDMPLGLTLGTLATSTTTPTIDATTANVRFGGNFLAQSNNAGNATQLLIGSGKVMQIGGNFTVGSSNLITTTTLLTATGGGRLEVNNPTTNGVFVIGGNTGSTASVGSRTIADFSGLSDLTIKLDPGTGIVRVNPTNSSNVTGRYSTLVLPTTGAGTTTIVANQFNIGDSQQYAGAADQRNAVVLGSGLTTLNVNALNIGTGGRDIGSLSFGSASGSIVIRSADGETPAALNIGTAGATTGVGATAPNVFDVTGHDADLRFGAVEMSTQGGRTSALASNFSFDRGTLTMESLNMSAKTGAGTLGMTSTVNLGGGVVVIGTGSGTAITMATNTSTASNASSIANLNITGGDVTVRGDIVRGAKTGPGTATATVRLQGGRLDLQGHALGSPGLPISFVAESGTLSNVGDLGGASLIKTGAGTLILTGTNTWAKGSSIVSGTLQVGSGSTSGTLPGDVINDGALVFDTAGTSTYSGNIMGGGTLVKRGSGTLIFAASSITTGLTTVEAGTLEVRGSISGDPGLADRPIVGDTKVDPGATFDVTHLTNGRFRVGPTISFTDNGSFVGDAVVEGTFSGTGAVTGGISVENGGAVSPGNAGVGTLTLSGALDFGAGSKLNIDFSGAPLTLGDQVIASSVSLSGNGAGVTLNLSVLPGASLESTGSVFFIVSNTGAGAVTGTFANATTQMSFGSDFGGETFTVLNLPVGANNAQFAISYDANLATGSFHGGNDIALMPVPEPGATTALLLGAATLLGLQRFRRRSA